MSLDGPRALIPLVAAALFAAVFATPAQSRAADPIGAGKDIGIGVGRGTFTNGITAKFYLDRQQALQFYLGDFGTYGRYGCFGSCALALSGDFVFEFTNLVDSSAGRLFLGAGGGGVIYTYFGAAGGGINGLFEMGWHFGEFPLELAIDLRPVITFAPYEYGFFSFDFGAAIRFFF